MLEQSIIDFFQTFSSPSDLKEIEDKIRNVVNARNVRLTEYFKDFDRLRTGFITSKLIILCCGIDPENVQACPPLLIPTGHFWI